MNEAIDQGLHAVETAPILDEEGAYLQARWVWQSAPSNYNAANQSILDALLKTFALNYSVSVQATLFQMGEAALRAAPEITRITLALPNKHCLLVNLAPFGLENKNEIFVPTDEPHGQIEATVAREAGARVS